MINVGAQASGKLEAKLRYW